MNKNKLVIALLPALFSMTALAADESSLELSDIEVIGVTPVHGVGLPADQIASNIQSATAAEIENSQSLDITDFMNKTLGSVSLNAAQNNPFQPDLQFRGFVASPLLGLAQGLSVYQDGVRINEPFGDAVNWELLPEGSIANMNLIPGSNPLFGLNTLGGAISVQTKNGFNAEGHSVEALTGSFQRHQLSVESGGNNGEWGYFINGAFTEEDGWRDFSPSEIKQLFGTLSYRNAASSLDLSLTAVDSDLNGNGASPVELVEVDRKGVFTHPDNTQNELRMLTLNGSHWVSDNMMLSGNVYLRKSDRDTFNGDGADYAFADDEGEFILVVGGDDDDEEEEEGAEEEGVTNSQGEVITAADLGVANPEDVDLAINNTSTTEQDSTGFTLQGTFLNEFAGRENQLIVGVSYDRADMSFNAAGEVAIFREDRGTNGTGVLDSSTIVDADVDSNSVGIFLTDTFSVTDDLALTLSGRYNRTKIDISGTSENGARNLNETGEEHTFQRFNPAVGLAYSVNDNLGVYGSYSEASRAPTPSELTCANPEAPCALPNSFLSDPPLDQVVAKTFEAGLRGEFRGIKWNAGVFHTESEDDIIFLPADGDNAQLNLGFFDNVGTTQRQGIEVGLQGAVKAVSWFANYSYVDATFEDKFQTSNPNNPFSGDPVDVSKGDTIPGIPKHTVKVGLDFQATPKFSVGTDVSYRSSQYYRGDEANNNDQISGYTVVNLHSRYQATKQVQIFAKIDNLLDEDYSTFGLYGEPDEAPGFGEDGRGYEDPRFVGAGAPLSAWIGVKANF